jgi:hypothetical protein
LGAGGAEQPAAVFCDGNETEHGHGRIYRKTSEIFGTMAAPK